jgi:hypothetical protein
MAYNFLDDFHRLNDNIKKFGLKDGYERTIVQVPTNLKNKSTVTPPNPRPLSNEEIKQAFTKRKMKVNPFD